MANVLVFIQQRGAEISKGSLAAIAAAQELGKRWGKGDLYGVCLGPEAKGVAENATKFGLKRVYYREDPALERYLAAPFAAGVLAAVEASGADTVVTTATSSTKDFFPIVAAALEAGQASEIVAINGSGSLKRPTFAGNVFADVEILTEKRVVTVRGSAFASAQGATGGEIAELNFEIPGGGAVLGYELSSSSRPELADAPAVVSGGRALQSAENFEKFIYPLADALGAAVGASRAAVDSGYAPNDWQVGQTGKNVAPNLYIAVGISGAIQHLAGMKDSKCIVAINKDPDAPIFEIADYGLVADLYEVLPALVDGIKRVKGG